jgi:hypothetical protein
MRRFFFILPGLLRLGKQVRRAPRGTVIEGVGREPTGHAGQERCCVGCSAANDKLWKEMGSEPENADTSQGRGRNRPHAARCGTTRHPPRQASDVGQTARRSNAPTRLASPVQGV